MFDLTFQILIGGVVVFLASGQYTLSMRTYVPFRNLVRSNQRHDRFHSNVNGSYIVDTEEWMSFKLENSSACRKQTGQVIKIP